MQNVPRVRMDMISKKRLWTPAHHTHTWFFLEPSPRTWKRTYVGSQFSFAGANVSQRDDACARSSSSVTAGYSLSFHVVTLRARREISRESV